MKFHTGENGITVRGHLRTPEYNRLSIQHIDNTGVGEAGIVSQRTVRKNVVDFVHKLKHSDMLLSSLSSC